MMNDSDSDSFSILSDGSQATTSDGKDLSFVAQATTNDSESLLSCAKDKLHKWLAIFEKEYCFKEDGKLVKKKTESLEQNELHESLMEIFGNISEALNEVTELTLSSIGNEKISAVCFVGTTGSGKSTLVQVLGADNNKIYSREVSPNNFIITDDSKIGNSTTISQTLYPELVVDKLFPQYCLCDTPGFEENRSSMHEIIGMSVMRKLFQHFHEMKIVLVCPHTSLSIGGNRNEFINILKSVTDLVDDVKQLRNSFYLVGSKVENSVIKINDKYEIASDKEVIDGIVLFLNEVKSNFSDPDFSQNIMLDKKFYGNSLQIIDSLLKKNDNEVYNRISILRKPMEEGCLSTINQFQSERKTLREMLLTDRDFVRVRENDFHITLSDTALKFLNFLFEETNMYVTDLSKALGNDIVKHLKMEIGNQFILNKVTQFLMKIKNSFTTLLSRIEKCENLNEYFDLMKQYSDDNKWTLLDLYWLKKQCLINRFLTGVENKPHSRKILPFSWCASLNLVNKFLVDTAENYNFLTETFEFLSNYQIQKCKSHFLSTNAIIIQEDKVVSQTDFIKFLKSIDLLEKYNCIKIECVLKELRSIVNLTVKHQLNFVLLDEKTLLITDYFVVISQLLSYCFTEYGSCNKVIIFAMHTVFIDSDMTDDWFKGKGILIFAPVWKAIGSREINVSGLDCEEVLPKAGTGEIGVDGKDGNPGGSFEGIGMEFDVFQNLKIIACGGTGQDGQEGGDGENGADGIDATTDKGEETENSSGLITLVYNRSDKEAKHKGVKGKPGSNSGEGGKGGKGGQKGTVTIHNIGNKKHGITVIMENGKSGNNGKDGKPGVGGRNGKDIATSGTMHFITVIPIYRSYIARDVDNNRDRAPSGEVSRKTRRHNKIPKKGKNACKQARSLNDLIDIIETFFNCHEEEDYKSFINDGYTERFIDAVRIRMCPKPPTF